MSPNRIARKDDCLVRCKVSAHYTLNTLSPMLAILIAATANPAAAALLALAAIVAWAAYVALDGAEFKRGRPDREYATNAWLLRTMRAYLDVTLHRASSVEEQLMSRNKERGGQAVFAFFPHGVNSDFRILMDGMMYSAFRRVWSTAPARTLAATILFRIPSVRSVALKTSCVDAGRPTATRLLRDGLSLMLCPGGQDEQIETIYGRERVFLARRAGFVKLALEHGVPLVPAYCFGSSDLYHTSRALHGFRRWLVRSLRVAIPLYWGDWGLFCYPTPKGFPLPVRQNIVFGDPVFVAPATPGSPTKEEVAAAHTLFVQALVKLFDEHKAAYGCGDRQLEIL